MVVAALCRFEGHLQDALNLGARVHVGVVGAVVVLILFAEVHATCELTNHHEIGTLDDALLQWRHVEQAVERGHGAHVGKQAKLLAHGQQAGLGAHLQCGIVVETRVAHSGEEHSVGVHTRLKCVVGERVSANVDGMCATDGLVIDKLVSKLLGNGVEHMDGLRHDLWSDAVAG